METKKIIFLKIISLYLILFILLICSNNLLSIKIPSQATLRVELNIALQGNADNVILNLYAYPPNFTLLSDSEFIEWTKVNDSIQVQFNHVESKNLKLISTLNQKLKIYKLSKAAWPSLDQTLSVYLNKNEKIDINQEIQQLALALIDEDPLKTAYQIAEWIRKNVKYDLQLANQVMPASWVLKNKRGVCSEYSILFIALCRSINLPARYVSGLAYSDGKFEEHAWAEVAIKNGSNLVWIPFDITFKQYGWLDPYHVKLRVGEPDTSSLAINYQGLLSSSFSVKAFLLKETYQPLELASLQLKPYLDEVASGSYLPLIVEARNLQPYYLFLPVFLTRAPSTVQDNEKILMLEPYSSKETSFLLYLPFMPECSFGCVSNLQVESYFAPNATKSIKIAPMFTSLSRDQAELLSKVETTDLKKHLCSINQLSLIHI